MAISGKSGVKEGARITVSFSDSLDLIPNQVDWTPKGVSLLTKWYFSEGTEVEFAFDHQGERHCCHGVVVACLPLREPRGCFETTLYFIEPPCSRLQKAACACRLARNGHIPADETHFTTNDPGPDGTANSARGRGSRTGAKS